LTGARDALNGYQEGQCFYCFAPIRIDDGDGDEPLGHVDHLIPFRLGTESGFGQVNLDGVWNLVLACPPCNLSKYDYVPHVRYCSLSWEFVCPLVVGILHWFSTNRVLSASWPPTTFNNLRLPQRC
jgi:hypothetical protein